MSPGRGRFGEIAGPPLWMIGDNHFADAAAPHDLAQSDALGVIRRRADPPAHIGIDREEPRLDENLSRPGLGRRRDLERPGVKARHPLRVFCEKPTAVYGIRHGLPSWGLRQWARFERAALSFQVILRHVAGRWSRVWHSICLSWTRGGERRIPPAQEVDHV